MTEENERDGVSVNKKLSHLTVCGFLHSRPFVRSSAVRYVYAFLRVR